MPHDNQPKTGIFESIIDALLAEIKKKLNTHAEMKKANLKHRSEIKNGKTNMPYPFSKKTITQSYTELHAMQIRLMRMQDELAELEWSGTSQGQIDPLREIAAAVGRIDAGISTRERETTEFTDMDLNEQEALT